MDNQENSAVIPRKEREKLARQRDILNAARDLFVEKGYSDTTLEEIARRAEFGKGTIYNYFNNKEELFFAIMDEMIDQLLKHVQSTILDSGAPDARTALTAYAKGLLTLAKENWEFTRMLIKELHNAKLDEHQALMAVRIERIRKVWEIIAQPIQRDIDVGKLRPVNAFEVARIFDGMLKFSCGSRIYEDETLNEEGICSTIDLIISLVFDGITKHNEQG